MTRKVPAILAALACTAAIGYAQSVISAHSGLVHYVEGEVFLAEKPVEPKFGKFPEIEEGAVLRTGEGRAEVLLTPGVFLRVGEDSAIKMLSSRLIDTRIELVQGSVLIECVELLEGNNITVVAGDRAIEVAKRGLFRVDAQPAMLKVYDGEALVARSGEIETVKVKGGRELALLEAAAEPAKFDDEDGDALHRWAQRRAGYLAMANVSAANSVRRSSYDWRSSGWLWNPYFGMLTYVPYRNSFYSPFGYQFWSPRQVYQVYEPQAWRAPQQGGGGMYEPRYNPNVGYRTAPRISGSYPSAPSGGSAPAAAPAPSPRTSGGAAPRQSSGGRGR